MDSRFHYLGFAANPSSNTSKSMGDSIRVNEAEAEGADCANTTLQLDSVGSLMPLFPATKEIKHNWSLIRGSVDQQIGSSLCLSLGHSSSALESKWSSGIVCTSISPAKEIGESSMDLEVDFGLYLANDKKLSDLELSLSSSAAESDVTSLHLTSTSPQSVIKVPHGFGGVRQTHEVSVVSHWKTSSIFHPLHVPQDEGSSYFSKQVTKEIEPSSVSPDPSSSIVTNQNSSVTCTSGTKKQQRNSVIKQCQFKDCVKGARGASGFCIAHGGGRRCQKPDCHKGAEGRTAFCKAHGGGRRCKFLDCTKSAEGRTGFWWGSHGGGRRCQYPQCSKGAQGSTMFCKGHGGGKRCTFEGCNKGAEGSTPFCKGHGGGKRCSFEGGGICPKSVHGGTLFCVKHGGGKRCAVPECSKSARGKFIDCTKSAQGSTDFCKAHGSGKRCSWGQPDSGFSQNDSTCDSFAKGKSGLVESHGALEQDKRVHGGGDTLGASTLDSTPLNPGKMKEIDIMNTGSNVLTSTGWNYFGFNQTLNIRLDFEKSNSS
uniref:WRKY19-like zinc finger domain-containing protein n=1 Tax=Solanum lycopersicum TaxID=4081 RepID=A0A3Q7HIB6_SOLLC